LHKDGNTEGTPSAHTLDELAKGLASHTITRRQVFKWLGGALVGGVLVSIPGVGWAQQITSLSTKGGGGGKSACTHFCQSVFGENTPGEEQCVSDAAHGQGRCFECGPSSTTGQVLCGQACCAVGQTCNGSGQCESASTCLPGEVPCQRGLTVICCAPEATCCEAGSPQAHCCPPDYQCAPLMQCEPL
jgi:hypothetical protein